jgi:hypothetical protein
MLPSVTQASNFKKNNNNKLQNILHKSMRKNAEFSANNFHHIF